LRTIWQAHRTGNLISFGSILFEEHDMPPGRGAKVAGVVIRISRPSETVIRHLVPFLARDLASFAADANARVGKEADLDAILHVGMLPLIRALDSLADHRSIGVMEPSRRDVRIFLITPLLQHFITPFFLVLSFHVRRGHQSLGRGMRPVAAAPGADSEGHLPAHIF
jgi:hypothetical protein